MEPESRNKGFAMLEVMMIIMIFMVLAASLFASAGAINRRTVSRAANNEAHYAALAAVKLMAGEIINHEDSKLEAIFRGAGESGALGVMETELVFEEKTAVGKTEEVKTEEYDGTAVIQKRVPVKISSKIFSTQSGKQYMTLTAAATVGGQTENVSLTLQERIAYVPDYPYGCGLMGNLSLKQGSSLLTGPDADVYLQGFNEEQTGSYGGITEVGGNLIADGTEAEEGLKLQLKNVKIGGMLISNDDVSLVECAIGNEKALRRGGIYTTGNLSLTNCDVGGDVYSKGFTANGIEKVSGSVNYITWNRKNYTVWGTVGDEKAVNTSDAKYRRNGEVQAAGIRKILNKTDLTDYVPKKEDVFVPETDGVTKKNGMNVFYLKNGDSAELGGKYGLISQKVSDEENHIVNVIIMEEGSRLAVPSGEWAAYIYGNGIVEVNGEPDLGTGKMIPVLLYGGIQAKQISIAGNTALEIYHGEPSDPAMKTPSSAVGFKGWSPLNYDMNPS